MLSRLVSLFLLLFFIPPISSFALPSNYKKSLEKNIYIAKNMSSAYIWGASGAIKDNTLQVDCSGLMYYLFKKSGIAVRRSTSFRMRHGLDGWTGKDVSIKDADPIDILFWTWKGQEAKRPFGHVGIVIVENRSGLLEGFHASGSAKKAIVSPIQNVMLRDLKVIRRITIGDK